MLRKYYNILYPLTYVYIYIYVWRYIQFRAYHNFRYRKYDKESVII